MTTHRETSETTDEIVERLPITGDDESPNDGSFLTVRLSRPPPVDRRSTDLAVLYLHGFGSRQDGEKANFFRRRAVSAGLAFCSLDFRGHGASGGGMRGLSLSRNLADIGCAHAWLGRQGLGRVLLFGSSMGGASGLWYAARHPDDVAAAIHIAPALELEHGLARLAGPDGLERWQRDGFFAMQHELGTFDLGWGLIEDLRTFDPAELRARYRTPTLILQGKHDASVSWRAVVGFAMECRFDGIEVHLIGDGDHRLLPWLGHLWSITESFLAQRGLLGRGAEEWRDDDA